MFRGAVAFVLVVAICVLAGCGKGDPGGSGPKYTYDQHCAQCHARAGQPGGPSLGGSKGPSLEKIGKEHDAVWLAEFIRDPKSKRSDARMMPAFGGKLKDEEIKELAEWLAARK
jgi:mono/diheme cytochrome c family protein